MSLANCLKKAGKALRKEDLDAIRGYMDRGMSEQEAVDAHLGDIDTAREQLAGQVEAAGGRPARAVGDYPEVTEATPEGYLREPQADSVTAVGINYNPTPDLNSVEGDRVYFYQQKASEAPARQGPGYRAVLTNLYDMATDPRGLRKQANGDMDAFEQSIVASGFDGYLVPATKNVPHGTIVVLPQGVGIRVEQVTVTGDGNVEPAIEAEPRNVTERVPAMTEAAGKLVAGEITQEEYALIANTLKPVAPYAFVPEPATPEQMVSALAGKKKDLVGKAAELERGRPVGIRLDIPAYRDHGVWIPTIHEGVGAPKSLAHEAAVSITGAEFIQPEDSATGKAAKVAQGGAKSPFAQITGAFESADPVALKARAEQALNDPAWVQVGYDPTRSSFFYDRRTGNPIVGAEEVIQVGPLVLAKSPQYEDRALYLYQEGAAEDGSKEAKHAKLLAGMTEEEIALAEKPLPQYHDRYFHVFDDSIFVPIDKIVPVRERKWGVANAKLLMAKTYLGSNSKRATLSLKDNGDGTYSVRDGNSTFAMAVASGWTDIPGRVLTDEEFAAEEAEKNNAIQRKAIESEWKEGQRAFGNLDAMLESAEKNTEALRVGLEQVAAAVPNAKAKIGPVKEREKAAGKIKRKRYSGPHQLADLARGGILMPRVEGSGAVVDELERVFGAENVLDEGWGVTRAGYVDRKLAVRMPDGLIVEVQVWTEELLTAKEPPSRGGKGGHEIYDVWRELPEDSPEAIELERQQADLYLSAASSDPAMVALIASSQSGLSKTALNVASSINLPLSVTSAKGTLSQLPSSDTTAKAPTPSATTAGRPSQSTNETSISVPPVSILPQSGAQGAQLVLPPGFNETDRLGDFPAMIMDDGFMIVAGDVTRIREKLPDGVKGTPIPGGLRFTPNQSHKAAAGLRGEKVVYSRAGRVTSHRKNKDGNYIGASQANNTPEKLRRWRKVFKQLAVEGEPGRFWYEQSGSAILEMVGGDVEEAKKFIALLAIYSPQAKVDANSTFALRAWAQYKAGLPIEVKTKVLDKAATEVLYEGKPWGGEKTNNFYVNLLREVDQSFGAQGATIDLWMMRAGMYDHGAPNDSEYAFMENETNRLANELGWEPQQVQAAVWVAMKARMENKSVTTKTEAISKQKGWISYNSKGDRVIHDSKAHTLNWIKRAMEYEPTEADTNTAKFDFSDGVRRHVGQISWEAIPSTSLEFIPGVHNATPDQLMELQLAMQDALSDGDGSDRLAQYLGILADGSVITPGVWQGAVSPSTQVKVPMAPAQAGVMYVSGDERLTKRQYDALPKEGRKAYTKVSAMDPGQKAVLDLYASTLGLLLRQDGVGYHKPFYSASLATSNGVEVTVGRPVTDKEAAAIETALNDLMINAGDPDGAGAVGVIGTAHGVRIVSFSGKLKNRDFHKLVDQAIDSAMDADVDIGYFASDGDLMYNNWEESPNGEDYASRIIAAGRPDLLRWAGDVLYPEVQAVYEDFAARYGWGEAPSLDLKGAAEQVTLEQSQKVTPEPPRGTLSIVGDQRIIRLGEASDPSTFIHESAHLFLEIERELARDFGVTPEHERLMGWLGIDSMDQLDPNTARGRELHEKFAETFEVYLRTGKAPSLSLREAFASFSRFLKRVYRMLTDPRLKRADLSPEITKFFDRMLASEEEIQRAAGSPAYEELFRSKEQAGMTDEQWAKYQRTKEKARKLAEHDLDGQLLEELASMEAEAYQKELKSVASEVKEELRDEAVYRALAAMREVPVDYNEVLEILGEAKLPGKLVGKAKKGGASVEEVAEILGYRSGKEMLGDILRSKPLNEAAMEIAEGRMREMHGDMVRSGKIRDAANQALANEVRADLLMQEIRALRKGKPDIDRKLLKAEAKRTVGEMKFSELRPLRYFNAMVRAAEQAAATSNPEERVKLKTQQLANMYLYREATKARDKMEKQMRFIRKAQKREYKPTQVEPGYAQNMRTLAEIYNFAGTKQGRERRQAQLDQMLVWYQSQLADKNGYVMVELLDPNLVEALVAKESGALAQFEMPTLKDMTVDDMQGAYDMLRHMRYVGGKMADADKAAFEIKERELAKSILKNGGRDAVDPTQSPRALTRRQMIMNQLRMAVHSMTSARNLIRVLDGFSDGAQAAREAVYSLLEKGTNTKLEMQRRLYLQFENELEGLRKIGLSTSKGSEVTIETEAGNTFTMNAEERFMLALYWGTESSRESVMEGHKITEAEALEMMSHLTVEQLRLVNAIWKVNESFWPEMSEASTRLHGVAPTKLEATPFEVNGVKMTGGHQRLFYQGRQAEIAEADAKDKTGQFGRVMPTRAGSTHARVGSGGQPVRMEISNITRNWDEIIHYIAFSEPASELQRLLRPNGPVMEAVRQKHGEPFRDSLVETLSGITANQQTREHFPLLARLMSLTRRAATAKHLMFSIRNTIQQLSSIVTTIDEVGAGALSNASMRIVADRENYLDMITTKSTFMRKRSELVNREAANYLNEISIGDNWTEAWARLTKLGFTPQIIIDAMFSYPTWLATYERSLEEHGSESRAITDADTAVAESVGSGSDLHLGRVFQNTQPEWIRALTLFGSWFNAYYQRVYRDTKGGKDFLNPEAIRSVTIVPFALAALSAMLIADVPDDEDDMEDWIEWSLKRYGAFMLGMMPVVRDIASSFAGYELRAPMSPILTAPANLTKEVIAVAEGGKGPAEAGYRVTKNVITNIIPIPGSGQVIRIIDGVEDGTENPYALIVEGKNYND